MLDAFDHLIQHFVEHFICGHAHYAPENSDIFSSEHRFQSFSVVRIMNQQFVFSACFMSIFNHSKHVAVQANDNGRFC